eukprot:11429670-Alexandrium_andersonii.AAC.1
MCIRDRFRGEARSRRARWRGRLAGQVDETVLRGLAVARVRPGAFVREVLVESTLGALPHLPAPSGPRRGS